MELLVKMARLARGLGILAVCWLVGEGIRGALGLVIPGGIIGLGLLVGLLALRTVALEWVEEAAALLLKWLPLLLLPAFVLATQDRSFLKAQGFAYIGIMSVTLLLLWGFIGWLAQLLFRAFPGPASEPGPLTEAEQAAQAEGEAAS